MPFTRPTLTELIERGRADLEGRLPGADSRLRRSVLDVLVRVLGGMLSGLYSYLDWVSRQILPDTSEAEVLARQAAIWGIARKAATPARGDALLAGVNGSVVPAGARLIRGDGVEYEISEEGEIADGEAIVPVFAIAAGLAGNAEEGQKLTFVSPVAGIQAVAEVAAGDIGGGSDEEDDESLRARLLDRIRRPPHGGNQADYLSWAREVPGVTRAWLYPGEQGPGTVVLRFVVDGRADIIPTEGEVEVVQTYLDELRPVTAALTVLAPVPTPLDLVIRVTPPTAAVRAAIVDEIADLIAREAEPGGTLLISHIREAISLAAGEHDHELISPVTDLAAAPGTLLVAGEIEWIGA